MKRLTIAILALPLMAFRCGGGDDRPAVGFPTLDDLPANVAAPCPEVDGVTGSYADLVTKDTALALAYASCSARHAAAVAAYRIARQKLAEAKAKADAP